MRLAGADNRVSVLPYYSAVLRRGHISCCLFAQSHRLACGALIIGIAYYSIVSGRCCGMRVVLSACAAPLPSQIRTWLIIGQLCASLSPLGAQRTRLCSLCGSCCFARCTAEKLATEIEANSRGSLRFSNLPGAERTLRSPRKPCRLARPTSNSGGDVARTRNGLRGLFPRSAPKDVWVLFAGHAASP